jgi:hypothetical protein
MWPPFHSAAVEEETPNLIINLKEEKQVRYLVR